MILTQPYDLQSWPAELTCSPTACRVDLQCKSFCFICFTSLPWPRWSNAIKWQIAPSTRCWAKTAHVRAENPPPCKHTTSGPKKIRRFSYVWVISLQKHHKRFVVSVEVGYRTFV